MLRSSFNFDKPIHTVWVVVGLRLPKALPAQLLSTKSNHYALLADGTRKVIGVTAFLTEEAAKYRWFGNLDKAAHDSYRMRRLGGELVTQRIEQYGVPHVYYGRRHQGGA